MVNSNKPTAGSVEKRSTAAARSSCDTEPSTRKQLTSGKNGRRRADSVTSRAALWFGGEHQKLLLQWFARDGGGTKGVSASARLPPRTEAQLGRVARARSQVEEHEKRNFLFASASPSILLAKLLERSGYRSHMSAARGAIAGGLGSIGTRTRIIGVSIRRRVSASSLGIDKKGKNCKAMLRYCRQSRAQDATLPRQTLGYQPSEKNTTRSVIA